MSETFEHQVLSKVMKVAAYPNRKTALTNTAPAVIADTVHIPRASDRVRTVLLIVGFALLTAALAQVRVPLGFTPVPVTLQTLGVLLAGAALGSRAGGASQLLYVLLGLVFPFYAGGASGWTYATGATGGYLIGMVIAAYVVGRLAERGEDRKILTSVAAMALGTVIIWAFGTPWLAVVAGFSLSEALAKGVAPFLIGDLLKMVVAGSALPLAWRLTRHV